MDNLKLVHFDTTLTYKGIKSFDCQNDMINRFVYKSLKKRVKKHLSQAYILLDEEDYFKGFYTLDTFSISRDILIDNNISGLPPIVPVLKLNMLAVDKSLQNQGIGKRLLKDVFFKVIEISKLAGCRGIYLLAEKNAINFYTKLGFISLKKNYPMPMFLDIEVILEAN